MKFEKHSSSSKLFTFFALWTMLLAGMLLGGGCHGTAPAIADQPVPKVTVTPVVAQQTVDADEYTGRTEASESVEVRARVFGYLKSIDFKDGDLVKEGQTLFTIEPDEYEAIHRQSLARVELNKSKHELAKANLARKQPLVGSGVVTREEYDELVASVKETQALITAAEADANRTAVDLKYTEVKAPISGRIDRAYVTQGNLLTGGLTSGTLLTKIVKEQPMYVYFDVDERSLLRYMRQRNDGADAKPGSLRDLAMPCYVQLADEKTFSHEGRLDFMANEAKSNTGTTEIRGVFDNKDRALTSGMFVRVRVPVSDSYEALMIPERAIAADQNLRYVYVVGDDNAVQRRIVELGLQRGDLRIVKSGLKAGERVVVKGLQRVRPGQKVEVELMPTTLPTATTPQPVSESAAQDAPAVQAPAAETPATKTQPRSTTTER